MKTFRTGPDGFTATMKPDGSIEWVAPTGHTYIKSPGAAILFPHWNIQTPIPRKRSITLINDINRDTDRGTMMPTRTRTRAQDRTQRIKAERQRNMALRANPVATTPAAGSAAPNKPEVDDWWPANPGSVTNDSDPPPF